MTVCDAQCGPNQHMNECAESPECDATCANYNDRPLCMPTCEERCTCIDGYVRRTVGGECIHPSSC